MSWIKTISYDEADPKLKRIYDKVRGPDNNIDNVLLIHSLRPHTLTGHMGLYKNVLHNSNNTLPKWYLEALGVYVSYLNKCSYCFEHHFAGFSRLLNDNEEAKKFHKAVLENKLEDFFQNRYLEGFIYARKLSLELDTVAQTDVDNLVLVGFTEGEVLEINQVVSYFNYVNRTVVGLGVNTSGDILGLSPNKSNDPDNWNHQ